MTKSNSLHSTRLFLLLGLIIALLVVQSQISAKSSEKLFVTSKNSPVFFERQAHKPSNLTKLSKENFRILASMYFWQSDAKKLIVLNPDLSDFSAFPAYPFTPLTISSSGTSYTIGGQCTAPLAGMSACPDIISQKIGENSYTVKPTPGFLDNHDLTIDSKGNFWAIRYLDYPARYFPEFFRNSKTSGLADPSLLIDRVSDCEVIKFDKFGKLIYRWSALFELPHSEIRDLIWKQNPTGVVKKGNDNLVYADLFHCNSIDLHSSQKKFLISARHTDSIYEIDIKSKKVNWKIGGNLLIGKSLKVLDSNKRSIQSSQLFGGQHDARYVEANQITVLDNSTNYMRAARGLLFSVSESKKTATLTQVFNDPNGDASGCTGSFRKITGKTVWFVAGWGCTKSGVTVFNSSGEPVVSLKVSDDNRNDAFRPIIPIVNTGSMISYRVTPHIFNDQFNSELKD